MTVTSNISVASFEEVNAKGRNGSTTKLIGIMKKHDSNEIGMGSIKEARGG